MTPEQRRRNKRTALVLVIVVASIMAWTFFRGSYLIRV